MKRPRAFLLLLILLLLDAGAWSRILLRGERSGTRLFFLDVGQGDSELISLPGARVLVDAGPDRKVLSALDKAMPGAKRIDLIIISHPQLDHFNGLRSVLDSFEVGAVALNGRNASPDVGEWPDLLRKLAAKNIPVVILGAGDSIRAGGSRINILAPSPAARESGDLNDTALALAVRTPDWTAFLAGDLPIPGEERLLGLLGTADILKVGHHGSRSATGEHLLEVLSPKIAVIEVGARNRYGHPASSTLLRLADHGAAVFRTDKEGTIAVKREGDALIASSLGE